MELINGVPRNKDGLIFELLAKYPPYYKSSEHEKWPRVDGRLSGRFNANDLTSSFTGTNRTVTDASGLQITLPASVSSIDHIDNALTPTIRLEPAAANILLGAPPTTQDLTLGVGSFTLQVFGAGTAEAAAGTATITGAGTASNGTPVTFAVTVAGTVTVTITTATVVWLCPGAIPSSYFAPAAAIGSELVTDGGFAAVTAGADMFDAGAGVFTTGTYSWTAYGTNTIANDTNTLKVTYVDNPGGAYCYLNTSSDLNANLVVGTLYELKFDVKVNNAGHIGMFLGGKNDTLLSNITDTEFASYTHYFNAFLTDGQRILFSGMGAGDIAWLDNLSIKPVTLTNWTAGAGWAPQAVAGALTNKAVKTAGTASAIEQDINAKNNISYPLAWTNDQSTSGKSINAEIGGVDGVTQTADATITDYIRATGTGNLKFEAADDWAGTIDTVSIPIEGYLRVREITTDMSLPETETTYDCAIAFELSYTRETAAP